MSPILRRGRSFGLALGGGAARGIAHLGILKVLEETGLRPQFITGTSAGSIVGALYAGGYGWETIAEVIRALDWSDFVQPVFPKMGLVRADRLEERLSDLLGDRTIEELDIPFKAMTVDLECGELFVMDSGPVAHAVRASCSIPGIFEPVVFEDRLLVDGGLLNDIPVDVCRQMGADIVLGVDLGADMDRERTPENIFGVLMASFAIMSRHCRASAPDDNTIIIQPDLAGFNYHNLKRSDEMIQRGEMAARKVIATLLRKVGNR
jgi:NTE family protein